MILLKGYIESGLFYRHIIREQIDTVSFQEFDINSQIKVITEIQGERMAICKWVSPKRTRSYPYARVYDILHQDTSKKVAIIPVVKDEGKLGDRDFLQWDTISLLSLLNVFIIPAYYCEAEARNGKLKNQKFDKNYVKYKLIELSTYKYNALHWNIKEFKNISSIIDRILECYKRISQKLCVELHSEEGLFNYREEITKSIENFINYSRDKAIKAQQREVNTIQPKEKLSHMKAKIDIENYLGGLYNFTVDEVIMKQNELILVEAKHSKNKILPSKEDIKDALLKIMLYKSINRLELNSKNISFRIALKLTTQKQNAPTKISEAINRLNKKNRKFYENMLRESFENNFEVYYYAFS